MSGLVERAIAWIAQDPDPETRAELQTLVDATKAGDPAAEAELHGRFDARLSFGTAGLRGELAAGPNRMNRVLVAQAAAGLAAYLLAHGDGPSAVIGYDGRKNSEVFARDTAQLLAGAGVRAVLLPRALPTPVLAFAVRHLDVAAGVMVTASHNPPRDNGYKVYLGGADGGAQIVPPADAEIATCIERVAAGGVAELPRSDGYEVAEESVVDAYVAAAAAVATSAARDPHPATGPDAAGGLRIVYTAMHGVGWETAARAFEAAGLPRPTTVADQIAPDPLFPTVAFPNPEEPGAMDLAFATARSVSADLVLANDPDADRLAVAVPDPSTEAGYRRLSGNEVGALLGWMIAEDAQRRGERGTLACSLVSSPALAAVAAACGHDFAETLTGFKWISRVPGLLFGFEEALGYLVDPGSVHDKDGISAAVLIVTLAARLRTNGLTLAAQLDRFAERFGAFASDQVSLRFEETAHIGELMARLRAEPPTRLGAIGVERIDDLARGEGTPPSDVLRILLEDGSRVIVRPSGTEPKLKVYVDAYSDEGDVAERTRRAAERVRELAAAARALLT